MALLDFGSELLYNTVLGHTMGLMAQRVSETFYAAFILDQHFPSTLMN